MTTSPDHSFIQYSPYIRLTVNEGVYTLWLVTYIPDNFTIPNDPTVSENGLTTQIGVYVESGGAAPSGTWTAESFKIANIPVSTQEGADVNATVYLDDPIDEGSTKLPVNDAEEE